MAHGNVEGGHRYTLALMESTRCRGAPHCCSYTQLVSEASSPCTCSASAVARSQIFGRAACKASGRHARMLRPPAGHLADFNDEVRTYLVHQLRAATTSTGASCSNFRVRCDGGGTGSRQRLARGGVESAMTA